MKHRATLAFMACLSAFGSLSGQALAQPAGAPAPAPPECKPASQEMAGGPRPGVQPPPAPPRDLTINAIPGVVAAGGAWTKVWQQGGNSADGIVPDKDGGVLFAQEDYDQALKLDVNGKVSTAVANYGGLSALAFDRQGRLWGLSRTERTTSTKPGKEKIANTITLLRPDRKLVTDSWTDGGLITVRPNDLFPDSHGGAYWTAGCLYYASPKGSTVVADNLRTNGIVMSPDDKVLYVTNGRGVVAFDVTAPGVLANRRDFAPLAAGGAGDGMVVDTEGRLYVTSGPGLQVFDKTGQYLGLIPTPRGVISVTFAGPGKKTLYVVGGGADDENGQPIRIGPQLTAATIYTLPVLSQGLKDRAK